MQHSSEPSDGGGRGGGRGRRGGGSGSSSSGSGAAAAATSGRGRRGGGGRGSGRGGDGASSSSASGAGRPHDSGRGRGGGGGGGGRGGGGRGSHSSGSGNGSAGHGAHSRLRILALHGSRQDGAVFAARIATLVKKLAPIADVDFADAPHLLPLADGQAVAMRCWWRHWALGHDDADGDGGDGGEDGNGALATAVAAMTVAEDAEEIAEARRAARQAAHRAEVAEALGAGGWAPHVAADWAASLAALEAVWRARGPYDGVVGFSNGAAAAFLLAAHAAAAPARFPGLRFAVLAGGYVPEPLKQLLPPALVAGDSGSGGGGDGGAAALARPLALPSLHIMGEADPVVSVDDGAALARCFEAGARRVLKHPGGHFVPQQARHCAEVVGFVSGFLDDGRRDGGGAGSGGGGRGKGPAAAPLPAPATAPVAAAATAAPAAPAAPAAGVHRGRAASAADAVPPHDPTEEQLEELGALEAIFGDGAFSKLSERPPRFSVRLGDPDACAAAGGGAGGAGGEQHAGPPSRLFSLKVALPRGYPADADPAIDVVGPLGANDASRAALAAHLAAECAAQRAAAGGGGFVFALVGAAREWVDEHLPPDVGARRDGDAGGGDAGGGAAGGGVAAGDEDDDAAAAAAAAAAAGGCWWDNEEADGTLVRAATEEAAAAQWAAWRGGDSADAGSAAAASADADAAPQGAWDTAAAAGQRGAWEPYVVGLVGKPSAGKSSLFNALTGDWGTGGGIEGGASCREGVDMCGAGPGGQSRAARFALTATAPASIKTPSPSTTHPPPTHHPHRADPDDARDEAKVGAYPFTTIDPNVGRALALLPDPAPQLGLGPGETEREGRGGRLRGGVRRGI